jgi:hypothetical protein
VKYLPVHCCCEPGRCVGYLPGSVKDRPGAKRIFMTPVEAGYLSGTPDMDADIGYSYTIILTQQWLTFGACKIPMLAYNADDTSIELLRAIPGFVELKS